MTDLRAAAQQALEALGSSLYPQPRQMAAIAALRAALAEPVQEPFGWVTVRRLSRRFENHTDQYQFYPAGQSPYLDNVDECHTVYAAPPQRKPLTEEEIEAINQDLPLLHMQARKGSVAVALARAIEQKHGIGSKP